MNNLAEIISDVSNVIVANPHSYADSIEYGHVPILVEALEEIMRLKALHEMSYSDTQGLTCEETLAAIFNVLDGDSTS